MKIHIFCVTICLLLTGISAKTDVQRSKLSVTIKDETGQQTPVRARLTDSNGYSTPIPEEAISVQYGKDDRAQGYSYQPDSSFYVDGQFRVELKPGTYQLSLSKGHEYLSQHHQILINSNKDLTLSYKLQRWINMPERNWYSGDDHIHIRRSPRDNPSILNWVTAEDIHIGVLLQMGDYWNAYYFAQYGWGKRGVYTLNQRMLTSGQEDPRTHEIGHVIALGADDFVRFTDNYYLYDHVFDHVHELHGLTGYAHQGMSYHGYRGMTLDILGKKVDFLEILQFCVPGGPLLTDYYYLFLDLGFKLTSSAGSDFPWCGKDQRYGENNPPWNSQIGNARFYTYINGDFSFENWKDNFRAGHTFVSSGPVIDLKINGKIPGDSINIHKGEEIIITAQAFGNPEQIPLHNLEIIGHSKIIDSVSSRFYDQSVSHLSLEKKLKINHGIWIAARCKADPLQYAHTTPIYITVDGDGFHNPETVQKNLDKCEQYLQEIEEAMNSAPQEGGNIGKYKEPLSDRLAETKIIIDELRSKLK